MSFFFFCILSFVPSTKGLFQDKKCRRASGQNSCAFPPSNESFSQKKKKKKKINKRHMFTWLSTMQKSLPLECVRWTKCLLSGYHHVFKKKEGITITSTVDKYLRLLSHLLYQEININNNKYSTLPHTLSKRQPSNKTNGKISSLLNKKQCPGTRSYHRPLLWSLVRLEHLDWGVAYSCIPRCKESMCNHTSHSRDWYVGYRNRGRQCHWRSDCRRNSCHCN
jgi:hypothetical protein